MFDLKNQTTVYMAIVNQIPLTLLFVEYHSFKVQRQYVQILNATRMNLDKFDLLAYLEKFYIYEKKTNRFWNQTCFCFHDSVP